MRVDRKDYNVRLQKPMRRSKRELDWRRRTGDRGKPVPELDDCGVRRNRPYARRSRESHVGTSNASEFRVESARDRVNLVDDLTCELAQDEDAGKGGHTGKLTDRRGDISSMSHVLSISSWSGGVISPLTVFLDMLNIDLRGKRALVAGVADDGGYGFAIAKALAEAGASICVGTWPPALNIFLNLIERGKMDASRRLSDGSLLAFERIYPLDAAFDSIADAPEELRVSKRYKDIGDFSIAGLKHRLITDFGEQPLDIVVHALANGPEVKKPLLETSRGGYLAAVGVSAYSMVSLAGALSPLMRSGGALLSLTYIASERAIPGYGGGMSSAKAALESDTRTLAYELGRKYGHRVNTISAGPYASRAASAIGIIEQMVEYCAANAPLTTPLTAEEVGNVSAFLCSPLAGGISGTTVYVDKGYHAMGMAVATHQGG